MIHEMYSVRDSAVGAFLPPFFVRSKGEAFRAFSSSVNDVGHQFNKYAHDYTLFFLGQYDDNGGVFSSVGPERVVSAIEVLVPREEQPRREPSAVAQANGQDQVVMPGRVQWPDERRLPPGTQF